MGGGLPIAAVTGRAEVMDSAQVGGLGGTYVGNPVACAAALAAIDFIETRRRWSARARRSAGRSRPASRTSCGASPRSATPGASEPCGRSSW